MIFSIIGNICCTSFIHFVLGFELYYSSARAVNKEQSIRSSKKFQGWNSTVRPYLQTENNKR